MRTSSVFVALFIVVIGGLSAEYVINENIQNWTAQSTTGNYTQAIDAGDVLMTNCRVYPTFSASGAGSAGCAYLVNNSSSIEFPDLPRTGTIELALRSSAVGAAYLQIDKGLGWKTVRKLYTGTVAELFTFELNHVGNAKFRLCSGTTTLLLYDIRVSDYDPPETPTACQPR
jgi:hypothetical protein